MPLRRAVDSIGRLGLLAALALTGCHKTERPPWMLANPATYAAPDRSFIDGCQGCHGTDGLMAGAPPRPVPRLLGQESIYLATALRAYRSGARADPTMRSVAAGLTDEQIDLAAKLMSGEWSPRPKVSLDGPPPPPLVQGLCAGCHGQTGLGVVLEYPRIGGQRQDYLKVALEDYQSGARSNPTMRTVARELSPSDIEAATAYFAAHSGVFAPENGSAR